jgi:hypothetical protein
MALHMMRPSRSSSNVTGSPCHPAPPAVSERRGHPFRPVLDSPPRRTAAMTAKVRMTADDLCRLGVPSPSDNPVEFQHDEIFA